MKTDEKKTSVATTISQNGRKMKAGTRDDDEVRLAYELTVHKVINHSERALRVTEKTLLLLMKA